jgi:hypothetical protein
MIDSIIEGINDESLKLSLRAASFETLSTQYPKSGRCRGFVGAALQKYDCDI